MTMDITCDYEDVVNFPLEAVQIIQGVLNIGAAKGYKPGGWRREPLNHHLDKAFSHLMRYINGVVSDEDHLEHALCRLAMAVAVRRAQKETD